MEPAPRLSLYGKTPLYGDFIARGLSPNERDAWDRWIANHRLDRPAQPTQVAVLDSPPFCALICPSQDRSDRSYPITLRITGLSLTTTAHAAACLDPLVRLLRFTAVGRLDAETTLKIAAQCLCTDNGPDKVAAKPTCSGGIFVRTIGADWVPYSRTPVHGAR